LRRENFIAETPEYVGFKENVPVLTGYQIYAMSGTIRDGP
jgi:hypothetical protein